jgi:hypothetical protein
MSGHAEEKQSWPSDMMWVILYSIFVLLLLLLSVYVPA